MKMGLSVRKRVLQGCVCCISTSMRRRCDVNRSLWFSASIVCLRILTERLSANRRGFSQVRANVSRKETLTGSLAVCVLFAKRRQRGPSERSVCKEGRHTMPDSRKVANFPLPRHVRRGRYRRDACKASQARCTASGRRSPVSRLVLALLHPRA